MQMSGFYSAFFLLLFDLIFTHKKACNMRIIESILRRHFFRITVPNECLYHVYLVFLLENAILMPVAVTLKVSLDLVISAALSHHPQLAFSFQSNESE